VRRIEKMRRKCVRSEELRSERERKKEREKKREMKRRDEMR
jgi:hypothetical protein